MRGNCSSPTGGGVSFRACAKSSSALKPRRQDEGYLPLVGMIKSFSSGTTAWLYAFVANTTFPALTLPRFVVTVQLTQSSAWITAWTGAYA